MNKIKKEKGITLVALIITIVILIILAVVAISAIQNEDILKYANESTIEYNIAQEKETIELAKAEAKLDYLNGDYLNRIETILSNENVEITKGTNQITVTFKKTGNRYTIQGDGTVIFDSEKTVKIPEIGTIKYVEGMTWKEWINSTYNKYGIYESWEGYVFYDGRVLMVSYDDFTHGWDPSSDHVVVTEIIGRPKVLGEHYNCEFASFEYERWTEPYGIS